MKLLVCIFVNVLCALSVGAFPTPKKDVPPQCADPTFACQDLENAKACGVVKSCIHDIWATLSAPDDNDEICDICKEMVKEARDQLLSNMTQEELKEVFEGSCKLLPIKLVADGCIKLVDEFIPELVEMLASRMDPTMVCTVSGMCNMAHLPIENQIVKIFKMVLISQKDDQCTKCTTMIIDLQAFLKSSSQSDVKDELEKACATLSVPSYLCDIFLDSYFPSIYTYLVSTDPKTLCSSAGICPQKCDTKISDAPKINEDLTCEFCEHVLQHVKDLVTTNTTVEEFRTALQNFCKHVGSFSDKCTSLVDDYYDMLFDYIRKLDTKGMCTLIGLCNNEKCSSVPMIKLIPALEAKKRISMIKLQPAVKIQTDVRSFPLVKLFPAIQASKKQMENNDIFHPQLPLEKFMHPLSIFQRDTDCAFCKAISFYIQQDLNGDTSKEGVRNALNNVCDKWVKDFPDHCKGFLQKHSLKMQHAVAKGVELEEVCIFSKVCVADDKKSELNVRVMNLEEGPLCDLCKQTMTKFENILQDPATKEKIENYVDQACNTLPKSLRDDCVNFVKSNVDALIDILQQELQPDNICPALKLCDSSKRLKVSQRVKDLECTICKDVVSNFREKMTNPDSKKIVLTVLEEGCARLPGSLSQECKTFVDQNIDTVLGMIIQELDPDTFCSILQICPGSVQKPKKLNDVECDLCKQVVQQVVDVVKDNKTEDEIKAALDSVCTYLPASMADKCKSFVDQYTETLITLLLEELTCDEICAALNLCPGSVQKPKKLNDVECDLCKQVVQQVVDRVKDNKTEDEIKAALDSVCSYLPTSVADQCKNFVDQYTDALITLLLQELTPDEICAYLNLCPGSVQKAIPKKLKDVECELCKEVVGKVEDMVKDQKTEDEIKSALESVCSYLPSSMAAKCKSFVDQYTDLVITLMMQELDPDMICASLKLCPAQDMECQGCQYALHYLQEALSNADTQAEVKNVLKRMCDVLPDTFSKNCDAFVDEYGASLLVLLAQEIDPNKLCYELQMCSNQTKIFAKQTSLLHPFNVDECSVCTTVVDYVDKLLEEDDVDKEITKVIEKICPYLPASYVSKCSSILDTYGPYILQMIGQVADSKAVCQEIDLCSRPPGHVHLLGGNKCTFGPSYWCKSSAHASACKAEIYCKDTMWKN